MRIKTVMNHNQNDGLLKMIRRTDPMIDVDITEDEFNSRMAQHQKNLQQMFEGSHQLESDIMEQLKKLKFNENTTEP